MGAGVSACQYSDELLLKVSDFAERVTKSGVSSISESCTSTAFNADGTEQTVPQKYIWVQEAAAPFVKYTEMQGKTIPQLWDNVAGAGMTNHTVEQIAKLSKELIVNTLAPEIRILLENGVEEEANGEKWKEAVDAVVARNIKGAQEATGKEANALAGSPDPILEVDIAIWEQRVYAASLEANPAASKTPDTAEPVAVEPVAKEPETAEPSAAEPEVTESETAAPETADPEEGEEKAAKRQKTEAVVEESPVSTFCAEKAKAHGNIPIKDEVKVTSFNSEGAEQIVPQKYVWMTGICAPFAQFSNMDGKTLPQLFDAHFGAGFTEFTGDELKSKAKELLESTLAPEIKTLLESGITEESDSKAWSVASGTVQFRNATQAKEIQTDVALHLALVGSPDEVLAVDAEVWRKNVWSLPLFSSSGKYNGDSFTREELEAITGAAVADENIEKAPNQE